MDMHLWEGELVSDFPNEVLVAESASGWVWEQQKPLLFRDLNHEKRFPRVLDPLRARGFLTYFMMPLTTAQKRLGALGVASRKADAYAERDQSLLLGIAELAALAVENALTRTALLEEKQRLQTLVDINRTLASSLEMQNLLALISECVTRVVPHDFAGVTLHGGDRKAMKAYVLSPAETRSVVDTGREISLDQTVSAEAFLEQVPKTLTRRDLSDNPTAIAGRALESGIQTVLCMPLLTSKGAVGTLNVGSKRDHAFSVQDQELLNQVAAQLAIALDNARAYREIAALKDRLAEEKLYLQDEIRTELHFEEIIGESAALKQVLSRALGLIIHPSDHPAPSRRSCPRGAVFLTSTPLGPRCYPGKSEDQMPPGRFEAESSVPNQTPRWLQLEPGLGCRLCPSLSAL